MKKKKSTRIYSSAIIPTGKVKRAKSSLCSREFYDNLLCGCTCLTYELDEL